MTSVGLHMKRTYFNGLNDIIFNVENVLKIKKNKVLYTSSDCMKRTPIHIVSVNVYIPV